MGGERQSRSSQTQRETETAMSRQGASWDDWKQDRDHRERVIKKRERILGLEALLQMWDAKGKASGLNDRDHQYVLKLRARHRAAQNQLEAMRE